MIYIFFTHTLRRFEGADSSTISGIDNLQNVLAMINDREFNYRSTVVIMTFGVK